MQGIYGASWGVGCRRVHRSPVPQLARHLFGAGQQGFRYAALRVGVEEPGGAQARERHDELAGMVEHRHGQSIDARQGITQRLGDARCTNAACQRLDFFRGLDGTAYAGQDMFIAALALDVVLGHARLQPGNENASRRSVQHGHDRAVTHVDVDGVAGFTDVNHGRPVRTEHGDAQGMAHFVGQGVHIRQGDAHGVAALQTDQPHLQGEGAELVMARDGILLYHPDAYEAHEIRMRLRGSHARARCEITQCQWAGGIDESGQQGEAGLDGLNAALPVRARCSGFVAEHDGIVTFLPPRGMLVRDNAGIPQGGG